MSKIKENLIYVGVSLTIIIGAIILFFYFSSQNDDNVYIYLKGESDRVRTSVGEYYLTEDEKNNIYKELDDIDTLIAKKEDPITTNNTIREIHNKLILMEKNNIENKVNIQS